MYGACDLFGRLRDMYTQETRDTLRTFCGCRPTYCRSLFLCVALAMIVTSTPDKVSSHGPGDQQAFGGPSTVQYSTILRAIDNRGRRNRH